MFGLIFRAEGVNLTTNGLISHMCFSTFPLAVSSAFGKDYSCDELLAEKALEDLVFVRSTLRSTFASLGFTLFIFISIKMWVTWIGV